MGCNMNINRPRRWVKQETKLGTMKLNRWQLGIHHVQCLSHEYSMTRM
jgi:hypothetical protein